MKTEDLPQRILKTFLPRRLAITASKRYKLLTADCLIVSYPKSGRTWLEAGNPDNKESFKVRKGKVGGYRDYLSESEIDRMNTMLDTLLPAELGYNADQKTTN